MKNSKVYVVIYVLYDEIGIEGVYESEEKAIEATLAERPPERRIFQYYVEEADFIKG